MHVTVPTYGQDQFLPITDQTAAGIFFFRNAGVESTGQFDQLLVSSVFKNVIALHAIHLNFVYIMFLQLSLLLVMDII